MDDIKVALEDVEAIHNWLHDIRYLEDCPEFNTFIGKLDAIRTTLERLSAPVDGNVGEAIEALKQRLDYDGTDRSEEIGWIANIERHIARLTEERENVGKGAVAALQELKAERTAHEATKAELAETNGKFLNSQASLICANSSLNGLRYVVKLSQAGHQNERTRREQAEKSLADAQEIVRDTTEARLDAERKLTVWRNRIDEAGKMVENLRAKLELAERERDRLVCLLKEKISCTVCPATQRCAAVQKPSDRCAATLLAWARGEE
jgi:chromosome segregation ATPase